jgi:hypothetical protein
MYFEENHNICDGVPRTLFESIYTWLLRRAPYNANMKIFSDDMELLKQFDKQRSEYHKLMEKKLIDIRRFISDIERLHSYIRNVLLIAPSNSDHIPIFENIRDYLAVKSIHVARM